MFMRSLTPKEPGGGSGKGPPPGWRRTIVRVLVVTAGLAAALIATLLTLLGTGRGALVRLALGAIDRDLESHLTFEEARLFPNGRLEATGLRLTAPDGTEILSAERVEARIALPLLLQRRIVLANLRIEGARLSLASLQGGGLNLTQAFAPRRSGPSAPVRAVAPWELSLPGAIATVDRFEYRGTGDVTPLVDLRETALTADLSLGRSGFALSASVQSARLLRPVVGPLAAKVSVRLGGGHLTGDGQLTLADSHAETRIDLSLPLGLRGKIDLNRVVIGPRVWEQLAPKAGLGAVPIQGIVRLSGTRARVDATVEGPGSGPLHARGEIDLADASGQVEVSGNGWNPARYSSMLPPGDLHFEARVHAKGLWSTAGAPESARRLNGRIALGGSRVAGSPIGPGEAAFRLSERRIVVESLDLSVPGGSLRGGGYLGGRNSTLNLELEAPNVAKLRAAAQRIAGTPLPEIAGVASARLAVSGPIGHPALHAELTASTLTLGGVTASDVVGIFQTPRLGRPIDLHGIFQATRMELGGRRLTGVAVEGTWTGPWLTVAGRMATRHGESQLDGKLWIPRDLTRAKIEELLLKTPSGDWQLQGPAVARFVKGLSLRELVLVSGPQRISFDGDLPNGGGVWLHCKVRALDLGALPADLVPHRLGIAGQVVGELTYHETPTGVRRAAATLALHGGAALGLALPLAEVAAEIAGPTASGHLSARLRSGQIDATFKLPWPGATSTHSLIFAIHGRAIDAKDWHRIAPALTPLEGVVSIDATGSGTLGIPDIRAEIHGTGLVWHLHPGDPTVPSDVQSHLSLGGARLDADLALERRGQLIIKAALGTRIDGERLLRAADRPKVAWHLLSTARAALDLSLEPLDLGELAQEFGLTTRVAGTARGEAHFEGDVLHPRGTGQIRIAGSELGDRRLGEFEIDLAAARESLEAHLVASRPTQGSSVESAIEIALPIEGLRDRERLHRATVQGSVRATNVPLQTLFGEAESAKTIGPMPPLTGRLDAELSLAGSVEKPWVAGKATVAKVAYLGRELGSAKSELSWNGRVAEARVEAEQPGGGRVDGAARISVAAGTPQQRIGLTPFQRMQVTGRLEAEALDLSFLSAIGDPIRQAKGRLETRLSFGGTVAAPEITGPLTLHDGLLAIAGFGEYRDLELRARLSPSRLELERLSAKSWGGTLVIQGSAERDPRVGHRFFGQIETHRFALWTGDELRAFVTSKLALGGHLSGCAGLSAPNERPGEPATPCKIESELRVEEARLRLPDQAGKDLQPLDLDPDIRLVGAKHRVSGRPLILDLHLVAPGPIAVSGSDLSATGKADLWAHLDAAGTKLHGRIDVSEGTVAVIGRTFTIQRATLNYGAPGDPGRPADDPGLRALATQTTPYAKIFVAVSGDVRHPQLDLHSEPPLSQSQISTLLATGVLDTTQGGGSGAASGPGAGKPEGPSDVNVGGAAASVAGAFLANTIRGSLGRYLPLDVLTLDPQHAEVGKHIGDRLYVGYVQNFGVIDPRLNQSEVHANYQLTREFSLRSDYGDAGAGALDLAWIHDW